MYRTIRVYWPRLQGRVALNFNWFGAITHRSVVHISACEGSNWTPMIDRTASVDRIAGAADITVFNIAPHQDGVTWVVNVNWGSPLDVVFDITVFDAPEQYHHA